MSAPSYTPGFRFDGLNRQTVENWLDAAGNIIRTTALTYDTADQMTAVSDRVSSSLHGNGYVTDVNNRLQSDCPYNYQYDD